MSCLTDPFRRVASPVAVMALVLLATGSAHAQIYRCEESGSVTYTNTPGSNPGCKAVSPAITTIPSPARAPAVPAAAPPRPAASSALPAGSSASAAAKPPGAPGAPMASPAAFPRVDTSSQKSRDLDRRRILEDELRKEETRYLELRAEFNSGEPERRPEDRTPQKYTDRVQKLRDDLARSESAMGSLRRELAALRD
jgi:hypothetical protein